MDSKEKIRAFSVGFANPLNTKFQPDKRKELKNEKMRKDQEEMGAVFKDYVESFEEAKPAARKTSTFIRGETLIIGSNEVKAINTENTSKIYKIGKSSLGSNPLEEFEKLSKEKIPKKKGKQHQKSELERFKEQLEAEEALKKVVKRTKEEEKSRFESLYLIESTNQNSSLQNNFLLNSNNLIKEENESFDSYPINSDESTNLYVGNISPLVTEEILCSEFGIFGPLASVKIMWPRNTEEQSRGRNCGFVAFMRKCDAVMSKESLDGKELLGYELKISWGRPIPIPSQPYYLHKNISEENTNTGLPFNARPSTIKESTSLLFFSNTEVDCLFNGSNNLSGSDCNDCISKDMTPLEQALFNSEVIVPIPKDITDRRIIHQTVEAVLKEGPQFEILLMQKVWNNEKFKFLYEYSSPGHRYYRWKLYSLLQGDEINQWKVEKFRLYDKANNSKEEARISEHIKKGQLSAKQRDELEDMLTKLSMDKKAIMETMGFCIDNCESASEIVECITKSLCIQETPIQLKIARFFVVSDILYNTAIQGASAFRTLFEQVLPQIIGNLNSVYRHIPGRMRAELFKKYILNCITAWEEWALYPPDFLQILKSMFTSNTIKSNDKETETITNNSMETVQSIIESVEPLSKASHSSLPQSKFKAAFTSIEENEDDIDGEDIVNSGLFVLLLKHFDICLNKDIDGEDIVSSPVFEVGSHSESINSIN